MSYRPARGRLREGTSGVGRSQAVCVLWGMRPRQGDWSDLWLNVIMRRKATSDRSVVTAAKWVYSTWEFQQPGERDGETLYRNRFAPRPVHVLRAAGKRQELFERMATGGPAALREEAAIHRRTGGGDHRQHATALRRSGAVRGAGIGSGQQPVPGDQPVGEEDRFERRAAAGTVPEQRFVAGGENEK